MKFYKFLKNKYFLLENVNSFVQINLEHYRKSCIRIVEKTLEEIRSRKESLKSFKLNIDLIKDGLKNYPYLQQLLNSINNGKWMNSLWKWYRAQPPSLENNTFEAMRHLSNYYESLEKDEGLNEKEYYDYANDSIEKTKAGMEIIKQEIERAINNLDWNGSKVEIRPEMGDSTEELLPISDNSASIIVGKNGLFSLFKENNKFQIDDILELEPDEDDEFFNNAQEKQDYYNLISQLQNPNRIKSDKILTLYTARPVKDRNFYNNTNWLPSNIFLTNSFSHADGLASDLSSGERRDVWRVRINSKYVVKTLDGLIKYYQVIKDKAPIEDISLA